jgi:chromosome segregation ATPase
MSSSPSETVTAAKQALDDLIETLGAIDVAADRKANAETALAANTKERESVKVRMAQAKSELERINAQIGSKTGVFDEDKARTLKQLNDGIAQATAQLASLARELKAKQERHDAILAQMGALAEKLELKRAV